MYEEEFERIKQLLNTLRMDASAKIVFLVDKNGQQIAGAGEVNLVDSTSLASLTAGNVAATDGLARLIGEKESSRFSSTRDARTTYISRSSASG